MTLVKFTHRKIDKILKIVSTEVRNRKISHIFHRFIHIRQAKYQRNQLNKGGLTILIYNPTLIVMKEENI